MILCDLPDAPAGLPADPVIFAQDFLRRNLACLLLADLDVPTLPHPDGLPTDREPPSPAAICRQAPHDWLAWERARLLALEHLHYGTTPPPELAELALAYLAGEVAPPPRSRGRQRTGAWYVALVLDRMLQALVDLYGLQYRRGEETEPDSRRYALDCAAAALCLLTERPWTADRVLAFLRQHE